MYSADDECVNLRPTLYPVGSVENWLLVVEGSMKNTGNFNFRICLVAFLLYFRFSVRLTLGDSLVDIYVKDRKLWVLEWPGQIVIAGSQTFWTAGVEKGIDTNTLKEFFDVLLENVSEYIFLIILIQISSIKFFLCLFFQYRYALLGR